jgi:hypothetical protein
MKAADHEARVEIEAQASQKPKERLPMLAARTSKALHSQQTSLPESVPGRRQDLTADAMAATRTMLQTAPDLMSFTSTVPTPERDSDRTKAFDISTLHHSTNVIAQVMRAWMLGPIVSLHHLLKSQIQTYGLQLAQGHPRIL